MALLLEPARELVQGPVLELEPALVLVPVLVLVLAQGPELVLVLAVVPAQVPAQVLAQEPVLVLALVPVPVLVWHKQTATNQIPTLPLRKYILPSSFHTSIIHSVSRQVTVARYIAHLLHQIHIIHKG